MKIVKRIFHKPEKIMIVAKQNKTGLRMGRVLAKKLEDTVDILYDPSTAIKYRKRGTSIRRFDGDMVITLGGDGTFLRAAHQTDIPILPVKLEGHGFLCTCNFSELSDNLERLLKGDYQVFDKTRIKCSKTRSTRVEKALGRIRQSHKTYPLSINEIAFARKRPSKILKINLKIDDTVFEYIGDGLMLSTASGSTAYNSSAGGSLIDPELDVMSIIPLYPFYSKLKPFIVPAWKKMEISVKGDCSLVIDGHGGDYLKDASEFIIERGDPIKVISLVRQNFYHKFKREFL